MGYNSAYRQCMVTRHTMKSRREISVNFGQVKQCVSRREVNKIQREKQQESKNALISNVSHFFSSSDVQLDEVE